MGRPRIHPTLPGETTDERKLRVARERHKRLYTPEQAAKRTAAWKAANPAEWREIARKANIKFKFGITHDEMVLMFENQEGLCGICSRLMCLCVKSPNDRCETRAEIDHDHETSEVRGLLCRNCNRGLGHFRDSTTFLRNAAGYLESA